MQTVDEKIETVHLYVVREQQHNKPFFMLPIVAALLCLTAIVGVTIYSMLNPTYEREMRIIPATFLPPQTFTATTPLIPTGTKTYPATTAHGILTLTNGSVIGMELPADMIFSGHGIEVVTDHAVTIPPGSAAGYGVATIPAHAIPPGSRGNIQPFTINAVYGTSLYIRNLTAFTGGADAYAVTYVTSQDRHTALDLAKQSLSMQIAHIRAIKAKACIESVTWSKTVQLASTCQFVAYPHVEGKVLSVRLVGNSLFIDVVMVVKPKPLKKG